LIYLSNHQIVNAHHDNGVEFEGEFEKACEELNIQQIYSRVRRPKDNPALERFNRTIQEEWLEVSEVGLDNIGQANLDLTEWLVLYDFDRPHQALDYQSPIEYATSRFPVSPMWAASTVAGQLSNVVRYLQRTVERC
ncbi:MAG: integrase core domain-containing protein, partial [Microgenomates group bacterium]